MHVHILADLGYAGKHALLILRDDTYLRIERLVEDILAPADVDESRLLRRRQRFEIVAVFPVDGNASSFRDESNYVIARNRVAASCDPYHQVVHAIHHDAGIVLALLPVVLVTLYSLLAHLVEILDQTSFLLGFYFFSFSIVFEQRIHQLVEQSASAGQLIVKLVAVLVSELLDRSGYECALQQFSRIVPLLPYILVQQILAAVDEVALVFFFEPLSYLVPRRTALCDLEPVYARSCGIRRCDDLHDIAVFQLVVYRHHLAVHARSDAFASDIRMYLECKVQRGRACRQLYDVALRSEYEHLA